MKRKDADEVNDHFYDFTLSSPALKIRRLNTELAPIIEEQETLNSTVYGQSMPFQDKEQETLNSTVYGQSMPFQDNFVEESMESSPIAIDELRNSVPVNEERAIVLFNPKDNTPSLQTPIPFSISSDFLSRFRNPVFWSNRSDATKTLLDETQKQDDNSGMVNGCMAVVPWVPSQSQHISTRGFEASGTQTSEMMESDAMDVEDNHNTQKHDFGTSSANQDWNQWQQHCMIQQPPSNFSTPITWLGR